MKRTSMRPPPADRAPRWALERARACVASWPAPLAAALESYFRASLWRQGIGARRAPCREPYWVLLPRWLWRRHARRADAAALRGPVPEDILWGQYGLYLVVRIQDDLFDGQASGTALQFCANRFLVEAEDALSCRVPGNSWFWRYFRERLAITSGAIVELDHLQQTFGSADAPSLDLHARVCEVLKVATAAVCAVTGRRRELRRLSEFCDHLAVSGQILDDLIDLGEDMERKRFTFVANQLLAGSDVRGTRLSEASPSTMARALVREGRLHPVLEAVRGRLRRALEAVAPLEIPEAEAHVGRFLRNVDRLALEYRRFRVETILGPLLRDDGQRRLLARTSQSPPRQRTRPRMRADLPR